MTKRPTKAEVLAAVGRTIPDLIAPRLDVLLCGINPGLYSAATELHFARPGNRFWRALYGGGFTDRLLAPEEQRSLLDRRIGITNLVARATAGAAELGPHELKEGLRLLERKVSRQRPRWVAVLGIGAYRVAFGRPRARLGRQPERLGPSGLWVLPNPSGLNAHHQVPDLIAAFGELHSALAD